MIVADDPIKMMIGASIANVDFCFSFVNNTLNSFTTGSVKAALPEVEGMKKDSGCKVIEKNDRTLLKLVAFLKITFDIREASPLERTLSPIMKEPIINHTISSASDSYNSAGGAACKRTILNKAPKATNPAEKEEKIQSNIAVKNAINVTFPL